MPNPKDYLTTLISQKLQLPYFTDKAKLNQSPIHSDYYYYAQFTVEDFTVKALTKKECIYPSHMEVFFQNKFVFNLWPNNCISRPHLSYFNEPEFQHQDLFVKLIKSCENHYHETHSLNYLINNFSLPLYSHHENDQLKDATIILKPSLSKNKQTLSCRLTLPSGDSIIIQKNGSYGNYNNPPQSDWSKLFRPTFEYSVTMRDKKRLNIFNSEINDIMDKLECFKEVNKNHRTCEITIQHGKVQMVKMKNKVIFQRDLK